MIRGTKKPLVKNAEIVNSSKEIPKINAEIGMSIHNRFDIEVVRDGEIIQKAYAENIILNNFWSALLTHYFAYVHYGTGSGTPSSERNSLFTFKNYKIFPETKESQVVEIKFSEGWASCRKMAQIPPEEYGFELTEIGIANGTASNTLKTHALLKDMNGTTISIEKTETDIINIYATIFLHWNPNGYDNGAIKLINFSCVDWDVTTYASLALYGKLLGLRYSHYYENSNIYNGLLCASPGYTACVDHLSSSSTGPTNIAGTTLLSISLSSSINSSLRELTLVNNYRLSISMANYEIGAFLVGNHIVGTNYQPDWYYWFFCSVHPGKSNSWYPGTTIYDEVIGTGDGETTDFATKYSFISHAEIKVNGVVETQVTIDTNTPIDITNMGKYFTYVNGSNGVQTKPNFVGNITGKYGQWAIYENPYYLLGIKNFLYDYSTSSSYMPPPKLEVSNDLTNWTEITYEHNHTMPKEIPINLRNSKYWKLTKTNTGSSSLVNVLRNFTCDTITSPYNIHFNTAPAEGAVITASYTTPFIAKDENHVFDFSLKLKFGEKTI